MYKVLNETLSEKATKDFDYIDGAAFARLFWNRTFIVPDSMKIRLDEKGERTPPMIVEDLNGATGLFDVSAIYRQARN